MAFVIHYEHPHNFIPTDTMNFYTPPSVIVMMLTMPCSLSGTGLSSKACTDFLAPSMFFSGGYAGVGSSFHLCQKSLLNKPLLNKVSKEQKKSEKIVTHIIGFIFTFIMCRLLGAISAGLYIATIVISALHGC